MNSFFLEVEGKLVGERKGVSSSERETRWSNGRVNVIKYIIDMNENVTMKLIIM